MILYPAILLPADETGLCGCVIPGININAVGATPEAVVQDAFEILQEVVADMEAEGEAVEGPEAVESLEAGEGRIVFIPLLSRPAKAA
jgi:predicted RNase H-like HicB family nuclease